MINLTKNIVNHAPKDKAILGLDVGKKTIGIALAHPPYDLVIPLTTLKRTKFTHVMRELAKIVAEYDAKGFAIGLPINMDDTEGPAAQSMRDFAAEMMNYPDIVGAKPWIALQDERLSTDAVYDHVDEAVHKKSNRKNAKHTGIIDSLAAKVILEDAIKILTQS